MRLSIQHPLPQIQHPRLLEDEVSILQRLGEPKALHPVIQIPLPFLPIFRILAHVLDTRVADLGARGGVDGAEHRPRGVGVFEVAGQAPEDEERFHGFGAEDVAGVADGGEAGGQGVVGDEEFGGWLAGFGGVGSRGGGGGFGLRVVVGEDRGVPLGWGPCAGLFVGRGCDADLAGREVECFWHQVGGEGVVGPDAGVGELTRDFHVLGSVEDARGKTDHAAGEAGEVLTLWVEDGGAVVVGFGVAGEEDVLVRGREGTEEEVFLRGFDGGFVQLLVLGVTEAKEEVLFGEVFVSGIGHAAEGEEIEIERKLFGVYDDWPKTGDLSFLLSSFEMVGDALDGVEVFGVFGELGKSCELKAERPDFSNECHFRGFDRLSSS